MLRDALKTDGWNVRCVARNELGMQIAASHRPDIVVLDVSKPEYAPEAVATGLRIHYGPTLPILAMATVPRREIARRIGAYEFLQKPFELDRLLGLLERGIALTNHSEQLRVHSEEALDRLRRLRIVRPTDQF